MQALEYPFDSDYILKKSKRIKKELLADEAVNKSRLHKKIAVLGGSTTHDIVRVLELFLLNYGISAEFYESEYAQYWQDAMFPPEELTSFEPDLIFVHTSNRNITSWPEVGDSAEDVAAKAENTFRHFTAMWAKLHEQFHCPVIQNNFDAPFWRLFGNRDAVDLHGRVRFVNELNMKFADYAATHESFYINDLNYLSSCYGLDKWADPLYWHMYKYAMCVPAIPDFAFSVANIIKSLYGKNKKALVLDLDNTLWGGVVGDDGVDGIEIGHETNLGQVYQEFQSYIKAQKEIGVMLNVDSKNDEENAIAGLNHHDSVLRPDDFIYIKANWNPKSENLKAIAQQINILPDSCVFVDDNPAEREIIRQQVAGVEAPDIQTPENYIRILDHAGYFEVTNFSDDDRKRNDMYKANAQRQQMEESFADYGEYLKSLDMKGTIKAFEDVFMPRIAQLTNKSNQFNLTTRRFTQDEIADYAKDPSCLTEYGRLEDKFGDNGIVSLVAGYRGENRPHGLSEEEAKADKAAAGSKDGSALHLDLWLMSCRVLKRDMEFAMMDTLVETCKAAGIQTIYGYYYPTAKNKMVEEFYKLQGFDKIETSETNTVTDKDGNVRKATAWKLELAGYENKNKAIVVNG